MNNLINKNEIVEKLCGSINCKQGNIRAVRFNADGNYCLTCGSNKTINLWNPHKCVLLKVYAGHGNEVLDAASSCDNAQIVSCGLDKSVLLWDVATAKILKKFRGHAARVDCVSFNEEGNLIISGSQDCTVKIWDGRSRKFDPIQVLDEAKDSITSIHVSAYEIFTGSADCSLRTYDIRNGRLTSDNVGNVVTSVRLTRDGQCILLSCLNSKLLLIDKESGELLNEYIGHKNKEFRIDSVVSSSDKHILSGSEDGSVFIWDLINAKQLSTLKHDSNHIVHSLAYHPTETCLLTACSDKLYIWKSMYGQTIN